MKPFFALLGLSFKTLIISTANIGRSRGKRKQAATGIGALVLLSGICLYLSGMYSFMLGQAFAPMGGLDIMLGMMIAMAAVWPLFFILFGSQGLIFSSKDVDLVLSLPVSAFSVMLARVLALYLEALMMCQLLLLPAGVAYIWLGGAKGPLVLVSLLVEGFFIALIPTLLALLFGALVALVVSRLPFKNLFTVLFSLLMIVGISVFSFSFSYASEGNPSNLLELRDMLASVPPLHWAIQGAMGNFGYLLLLAAVCTAPFFLVVWVFSRFYKGMLTRLSSHRLRTDYKVRSLKTRSPFSSLIAKEARRFFGTPAYLLNSGIMILLTILACAAAALYKGTITPMLAMAAAEIPDFYNSMLLPVVLLALCVIPSLTFISSVSISLEGKTLWVLKEMPIDTGNIFAAKAGFAFLMGGIGGFISCWLVAYALSLPLLETVLILVVCLLFCLLSSTTGLLINLFLPRLDAENETMVIKQSASMLVSMLVESAFCALFVLLYFALGSFSFVGFCAVSIAALLLLNAGIALLLNTKGRRLFAAL